MAKARTPSTEPLAGATDRQTKLTQAAGVTDDAVARRAYDLYLARGQEDGHDVDDWLEAERELRTTS